MALKLTTPPTTPLVPLEEAKSFARVSTSVDDATVTQMVAAAARRVYELSNRQLMPATWELTLDEFPSGSIRLDVAPLLSVASVKYYDEDGVQQTLDPGGYYVDNVSEPGWVVPGPDSWPATGTLANAVVVRFVAGYAPGPAAASEGSGGSEGEDPRANVPEDLILAAKMLVAHWFNYRELHAEGTYAAVPEAALELIKTHRIFL